MATLPIWAARPARAVAVFLLTAFAGLPQTAFDAYKALQAKDYDAAIRSFREALKQTPNSPALHKDLAYTLLKVGDNTEARDEFETALKIDPKDDTAGLEFAFLAFETGKPIEARRMFDRLRHRSSKITQATAEQAFHNIDDPLVSGIARWKEAVASHPEQFSAHWELAQLAEKRDELDLAAQEYTACFKLKAERTDVLLALARCWGQLNRAEDAHAALLAASRCKEPRTAENARELMGERYPYAYEFKNAIALTPQNVALRRELAYLLLAMGKQDEAIAEFGQILSIDPRDKLSQSQLEALQRPASATRTAASAPGDNKAMGLKSFALGYSQDAVKYLRMAHEDDPNDAEVMLKLGYAYNYAHDDADAVSWFDRARHSDDPAVAREAGQAYRNLTQSASGLTTIWSLPMFSSRWRDVFDYGQIKHDLWSDKWVSAYASARVFADAKSGFTPEYLSDTAVVLAAGVSSHTWRHLTAAVEAGEAVKYLPFRHDEGAAVPDYRADVNFARGFGHLLNASSPGIFADVTGDAVYMSRYDHDWIYQVKSRVGYTWGSTQFAWNVNGLHDSKRQYWARTVETGPGLRWRAQWMPQNVYLSLDVLRGAYTDNVGNPRRPNYNDIRAGLWYAVTK